MGPCNEDRKRKFEAFTKPVFPENLPDVKDVLARKQEYEGPTDESNWVIPGHLLVGAYPADTNNEEHQRLLKSILDCGVTTFVCLQKEYDHEAREPEQWERGAKIRPYIEDAHALCESHSELSLEKLSFVHVPIADCDIASDAVVKEVCKELCHRLRSGEVLYVHCWGGHGRTGTFVAIILGMLYKLSKAEALKRTQLYHDLRRAPLDVPSPQTFSQRMQVLRILDGVKDAAIPKDLNTSGDVDSQSKTIIRQYQFPIINSKRVRFQKSAIPPTKTTATRKSILGPTNSMQRVARPLKPPVSPECRENLDEFI